MDQTKRPKEDQSLDEMAEEVRNLKKFSSPSGGDPCPLYQEKTPEQQRVITEACIKIFDEVNLIRSQNHGDPLSERETQPNIEETNEEQNQFGLSPKDKYYFQL